MEDLDRHYHYELRLTAEPSRFGVVRRIVQAHLRHWNLGSVTDQTVLGVTELLANVHQHVGRAAPCTLRLHAGADTLTVSVSDDSAALPQARGHEPLGPGGRGLALVAGLCKEWGAQADEHGKTVWFTVATSPLPDAAEPARTPLERTPLEQTSLSLEVETLALEAVLAD